MKVAKEILLMGIFVAAVAFCGLFFCQTNRLVAALEDVRISYSSHNRIRAASVTIVDGEYDAGVPAVWKAE